MRQPPDLLITTPESLYLMLTPCLDTLRSVQAVIIDEIHAVAATKRGSHLALTLERLDARCERLPQRIGSLSATQRPLEEIARFLGGFEEDPAAPARRRPAAGHRRRGYPASCRRSRSWSWSRTWPSSGR